MIPTRRPIVLVVEDDLILRLNAVDIAEDAGFEAIEAADADEAIAILEARSDIVILFTDIDMPGSMNGLKLSHAVRNSWPPIHIIATSGKLKLTASDLPAGSRFFPKPYLAADIAAALQQLAAA